jgi:hypothetical protein
MDRYPILDSDPAIVQNITDTIDGLSNGLEAVAVELEQLLEVNPHGLTYWSRADVLKVVDRCRLLARTNGETSTVLRGTVKSAR